MEIVVFIKPVLDPDMPPAKFSVDGKTNRVIPPEGMPAAADLPAGPSPGVAAYTVRIRVR